MKQVSDYELELMKVIWAKEGTALYAGIVAGLEEKGISLTKNTILSLLSRLIDKGILKIDKMGRRNIYTAIVSEDEYQTDQTVRFLDKVYEGNTKGLVSTLITKNLLSQNDYKDLQSQWEEDSETK